MVMLTNKEYDMFTSSGAVTVKQHDKHACHEEDELHGEGKSPVGAVECC